MNSLQDAIGKLRIHLWRKTTAYPCNPDRLNPVQEFLMSLTVPPLSTSNHAYEDIEPPQGDPTATSQLQRQNAVDIPATQQPSHQPCERAVPEKQREVITQSASSAPSVPPTRRPSDVYLLD